MPLRTEAVNWDIVPIDLARFERGAPFSGDLVATLAAERERLSSLQMAQIVHGRRLVVALDGWSGSGRRDLLRAICAALDPILATAHEVDAEIDERQGHWLAPYWSRLPRNAETSLFLRSWNERAIAARISGRLSAKQWGRYADEINEFENAQAEHGTRIVKLFLHVTEPVQTARLQARLDDPWQRWRLREGELLGLKQREGLRSAWTSILTDTDTRWAPWVTIDANDDASALIAGLRAVGDAMAKAFPSEPPAPGSNVVALNRTA